MFDTDTCSTPLIFILLGSAVYTQANIIKFNTEVAVGSNAFSS